MDGKDDAPGNLRLFDGPTVLRRPAPAGKQQQEAAADGMSSDGVVAAASAGDAEEIKAAEARWVEMPAEHVRWILAQRRENHPTPPPPSRTTSSTGPTTLWDRRIDGVLAEERRREAGALRRPARLAQPRTTSSSSTRPGSGRDGRVLDSWCRRRPSAPGTAGRKTSTPSGQSVERSMPGSTLIRTTRSLPWMLTRSVCHPAEIRQNFI
ncbi:hypothetical protein PAHAL_8G223400 [Panicum hallii]|jgi:hypothetical protein|uniref:Uncharacterized protein n=1 Tax=Panicum hallii TaxID=206008 RepID=A0A2S3IF21_9POAL|nr:hypothetical protein PAHAL_8G223400 [Panicum hallii]